MAPQRNLPITQKLITIYKLWQECFIVFPKNTRYTLGHKIDGLLLEITENIIAAAYLPKSNKGERLWLASSKIDILKCFLQIAWEIKSLDNKKYIIFSEKLNEIGKMLGGWLKQLT